MKQKKFLFFHFWSQKAFLKIFQSGDWLLLYFFENFLFKTKSSNVGRFGGKKSFFPQCSPPTSTYGTKTKDYQQTYHGKPNIWEKMKSLKRVDRKRQHLEKRVMHAVHRLKDEIKIRLRITLLHSKADGVHTFFSFFLFVIRCNFTV